MKPTPIGHALKALDQLSAQRQTLSAAARDQLAAASDAPDMVNDLAQLDEAINRSVATLENGLARWVASRPLSQITL